MSVDSETIDLHKTVARIDTNVGMVLEALPALEKRVSKLERRNSFLTGALFVIAAICAKLGLPDLTFGMLH